ncbi:acetyltransferase [Paenibacillus alkaliterrae]|nr:GNAT family N-acetyltransferase [Paenibacillus alkaliterrae]MCF2938675.1 acetyltransferase [Paenibacillus alkaliterrae]
MDRTISFRCATIKEDVHRLHHWHHQNHVIPFWKQNFSFPQYREYFQKLLADRHQTLYIGHLNGKPMSYWESYWAKDDIIAGHYEVEAGDQGIHLLFGPEEFLGKGYALPLLRAMTAFQFQHQDTKKVITEPDIRNEKVIHIFKKCGFEPQKEIDLPDKRALLMFCYRETFLGRWKDVDYIQDLYRSEQHV